MENQILPHPNLLDIEQEIQSIEEYKKEKLMLQLETIKKISSNSLQKQKEKLEYFENHQMTYLTQKVKSHMDQKHQQIIELYQLKKEQNKITPQGYARYLTQAWYCIRYNPELQSKYLEKLAAYAQSCEEPKLQQGKKILRSLAIEFDEEIGHDTWALQDLKNLGIKQLDLFNEIFSESKALIAVQFDRLNRLNFISFLGYPAYMEFITAKQSVFHLEALSEAGVPQEAQTFLYNHYVVDQGHAAGNLEIFNFLLDSDEIVHEVIDNLDIVHLLYHGLVDRAFS